jgi:hypothetical protein
MQELISRLTEKAGISADQAGSVITTIKEFVGEKFPALSGAVDNVLGGGGAAATAASGAAAQVDAAKEEGGGMLDKISDVIPGAVGEKVENAIKGIAGKFGL